MPPESELRQSFALHELLVRQNGNAVHLEWAVRLLNRRTAAEGPLLLDARGPRQLSHALLLPAELGHITPQAYPQRLLLIVECLVFIIEHTSVDRLDDLFLKLANIVLVDLFLVLISEQPEVEEV